MMKRWLIAALIALPLVMGFTVERPTAPDTSPAIQEQEADPVVPDPMLDFVSKVLGFVPLVAAAAPLIAFVIDTAKRFGFPDGYAPALSGALNVIAYAVVYFGGEVQVEKINNLTTLALAVGPVLVSLLLSLWSTAKAHKVLESIGIGYSHPLTL